MSDETRRSPWLPVNGPDVQQEHVFTAERPVENVLQADAPGAPPMPGAPAEAPTPTRRASVLSPYLVTRSSEEASLAEPPERNAYSGAPSSVDPATAWSVGPASVPVPMVGLSPELGRPAGGAIVDPSTVDSGHAASRPASPGPTLRGRVPRPVEAEEVEVIRPIMPPPASEILPSTGSLPVLEPADHEYDLLRQTPRTPIGPESDPFFALGVSAVASASLSAAGAPSAAPVEWVDASAVPTFGEPAPFVPMFAPQQELERVTEPEPTPAATPAAAWTPIGGIETVKAGTDLTPPTQGAGLPTPPQDESFTDSTPWWRKLWVLIALGVVVIGGLGFLAYRLFLMPEPIILPAPVVTEAPPAPTIEPVEITDPSDLLAAMPREISTLVMTSFEDIEVLGDKTIPARASEHLVLTYGESTGEDTFTVNAYQFFNADEAQKAFEAWVEGQTEMEEVTVDGKVVGQRAMIPGGAADTLAWRNETMVFVMQGPPDELLEFYSYFGF